MEPISLEIGLLLHSSKQQWLHTNTIIETNDKKCYLADVKNLKEENVFINPNKVEQINKVL
jgi:hypothetical protein